MATALYKGACRWSLSRLNPSGETKESCKAQRKNGISKKTNIPDKRCVMETNAPTGREILKGLILRGRFVCTLNHPNKLCKQALNQK